MICNCALPILEEIGFVTNESEFALGMNLGQYLTNEDENLFDHLQKNIKTDSMGMDTIVYFPNIQMPDEEDEDDESEESEFQKRLDEQYTIHNDFDDLEDDSHLIIDDETEMDKQVKEMVIAKFNASEDDAEQQRRDEKHGLYPALLDPAN